MQRNDVIEKILDAMAKPMPEIAGIMQCKGTDGKWYGAGGFPHGVAATQEWKIVGYAWRAPDGTTYGTRAPSQDELIERWNNASRVARDKTCAALQSESNGRLQEQWAFWMKTDPPPIEGRK
jgi:hypothetical protein